VSVILREVTPFSHGFRVSIELSVAGRKEGVVLLEGGANNPSLFACCSVLLRASDVDCFLAPSKDKKQVNVACAAVMRLL
jgi:hypothetical protein